MHHSAKDNYVHLTTTPVPRLITSLAVPTIISMLVTSFYNMADTYFVGKINTQSTAAVGIVFSVMSIIQAVGFFFGHGSGNYISRKLGGAGNGECREDGIHRLLFCLVYRSGSGCAGIAVPYTAFPCFGVDAYYSSVYGALFGNHSAGYSFYDRLIGAE